MSLAASSYSLIFSFFSLHNKQGGDPDVSAIIPLSARAHNELLQSHCQRVSGILIRECITPIDDILNELLSIQQLMKERNKDMKEVIYYMSKLGGSARTTDSLVQHTRILFNPSSYMYLSLFCSLYPSVASLSFKWECIQMS